MATSDKPRPADPIPADILPIIRNSGALNEKQFGDLRAKVLAGDYPADSRSLARALIRDGILTEYQARRFLIGKSHGLLVGKYIILDRLGSGSMGRVYKAHHPMMERVVALKIIAPEIVTNERVVSRFQREMKLVGRLDHPNVVRAFDADQAGGTLYLVMEYVPGQSLGQRLKKGPLPAVEAVAYAAQAALGLAHAHEQGMVHRDVKPSNLLVTTAGQVKVLDLGLGVLMQPDHESSFATADGVAVGTVDYMSPEQACGRDLDGRSDLFSLGCALYHLITGKQAFAGDTPIERLGVRIANRPTPINVHRPDLPTALVRVIDRLLATKPQDRYQNGAEAADALLSLVKPRNRPSRPAAAIGPPVAVATGPADIAPSETSTAEVSPASYVPPSSAEMEPTPPPPRWAQPLAILADRRPRLLVGLMIAGAAASAAAGFAAGWFGRGH